MKGFEEGLGGGNADIDAPGNGGEEPSHGTTELYAAGRAALRQERRAEK